MKCCVDGCEKEIRYKAAQLCQMHYFRKMRYGTTELTRKARYRYTTTNGYQLVHEPKHPLAGRGGYVYEHRKVLYDATGSSPRQCELCGVAWAWEWVNFSHVDHINEDKSDNRLENLRPLCNSCNVTRSVPAQHTWICHHAITLGDKTMTAAEWAREPGVFVCGPTIIRRLSSGVSVQDALFSPKRTHNGNIYKDKRIRKTQSKHERSNAIAITVDGVTMTAAEWSRHPMCLVNDRTLINRIRSGMDHKLAVFTPPKTGKNKKAATTK